MYEYEMLNAQPVSRKRLEAERAERKALRESGVKDNPMVKSYNTVEAVNSIGDMRAKEQVANIIRKAVNSYDIQGRRLTSYYDEMFELANADLVYTSIVEQNGIAETTDYSVSWREVSPNNSSSPAFFNANNDLPVEAQSTESIRSNTCGTYGNTILVPWVTQEIGEKSALGAYDTLSNQMKYQMLRMKKFREQKFVVNSEVTSELVGDIPQWQGFYTDSSLNVLSAGGGLSDVTEALLNALHVAIGNPSSIDSLGVHTGLVVFSTPQQLDVVRKIERDKWQATTSETYLANQARLAKMLPGVNLDPDQVVFFKPRLGAVMAFVYAPFFTALAANTLFAFDPNRPRIVKFKMMGQFGPWVIKREIPQLIDEMAVFDFEGCVNPNRETRGSVLNVN